MSLGWTHVIAYDDIRAMIALAHDGTSLVSWRAEAAASSRLFEGARRTTQLHYASLIIRTHAGTIQDGAFIRDVAASDAATARDLIYARYLASVPLAVAVAREIFHPVARHGERTIQRGAVERFLGEHIAAASDATRTRSLSSIVTEFARAGVIHKPAARATTIELTGRVPAPLALAYLIDDDLRERREASDAWLVSASLAATLFALTPSAMRAAIESLVVQGRLRRSYYAGEPRILAA